MTFWEAFVWGRDILKEKDVPDNDIDARYLLEEVLNITRSQFLLRRDEKLQKKEWLAFQELIKKRSDRIPLAYLIEKSEFMGLEFYVNNKVLIPRQETECLVEEIIPRAKNKNILDMCTGSGCIGISIAILEKTANVVCSDISSDALEVAKKNTKKHKVDISFVCGDLFDSVQGTYDIIVCNPPYIKTEVICGLMPEVKNYEPILALDGKETGLYFYSKVTEQAFRFLNKGGLLAFEIGYDQGEQVVSYMKENGFTNIEIKKDLAKLDRMVIGEYHV